MTASAASSTAAPSSSATANAVAPVPSTRDGGVRERGAQRRERARERARPRELAARQRGRGRRDLGGDPSRSSAARERVVGDRIEVDALATRPDRRQEVVGRGGDEHHDRARRRLLDRLQHRVRRLVLVAAQPLGLEEDQHAPLGFDRRARRLGQDRVAHVFLHAVRRAARRELDDVGMHAALHEAQAALVVADADQQRGELARRVLDTRTRGPTSRYACDGRSVGAAQRLDRALLTDHVREHRVDTRDRLCGCDLRPSITEWLLRAVRASGSAPG